MKTIEKDSASSLECKRKFPTTLRVEMKNERGMNTNTVVNEARNSTNLRYSHTVLYLPVLIIIIQ
jgi:hypothetical protein